MPGITAMKYFIIPLLEPTICCLDGQLNKRLSASRWLLTFGKQPPSASGREDPFLIAGRRRRSSGSKVFLFW